MNKKDNITILKDLNKEMILITIGIPLLYFFQLFNLNNPIVYTLSIFYLLIPTITTIFNIYNNKGNLLLKKELQLILIKLLLFQLSLIISLIIMQKIQEIGNRADDQLAERMIAVIIIFFIPLITWIIYLKHIIKNYNSLRPSKKYDYEDTKN